MADDNGGWKQFHNLSFDSKKIAKRVKKAEGATMRHAHKFIVGRLDNIRSVRRHIITWLTLVGLMIIVVGLQFVWFQSSYQTTVAAKGGTYAEGSIGPIDTLNPLYASSSAELAASKLLFSSLFNYDETGHLHGDLAEAIQVDPSGTIYTITLRSNAKWHDGGSVTAKDVAFTVNLIKNPEARSSLRVNWQDVEVKTLNSTTVQFQLPAVYAAFPHALTFAILPEHLLGRIEPGAIRENAFSRSPVGSGPFSFRLLQNADVTRGHKVVHTVAFDDFYKGAPLLNRFEVHAYDKQEAIIKALRSGEINAATDITGVDSKQVGEANYTIISRPINSSTYAVLNNDSPILKDKIVRQALQAGTDTKAIRKQLVGNVPQLELPFIHGQLNGTDVPRAPKPDPAKARALLDQAGWKLEGEVRKKESQTLSLTIVTTKDFQYERALESLAGQWRKLGIVVITNIVDTSDPSINFVQSILQARNYDVLLYELFIGADPDVYAYWHSSQIGTSGYNFANYVNKTADAALASSRSRLEPGLRNVKYKAFAKQWLDDAPAIGLYQSIAQYAVNKHMASIDPSATLVSPQDRFSNILYWSAEQNSVYKTP